MNEVKISADHIYTVDGVIVPSVSNILDVYFPPSGFYTEQGRDNGHFRHLWYAFLAQENKPEAPPEPDIAHAIHGYEKFLVEVKPEYVSGEIPYFNPSLKCCGTPDVVFKINSRLAVVDYKPKARNKRTQVQTALYYLLLRINKIPVLDRYELRLYDDIYRLEKHEDLQDMRRAEMMAAAFHAAQYYK